MLYTCPLDRNQNYNTVKTIFLFVLIAPFMMAQPIFDKYQSNDQVTYVSISPRMFQMLANMNIDDSNPSIAT